MKRQPPGIETETGGPRPSFRTGNGSVLSASGSSAIPSRLAAQMMDGTWNAVVTTLGRGTFLIRRRNGRMAAACPLRAYEIRHIAADCPVL